MPRGPNYGQAKTLTDRNIADCLRLIENHRNPLRDRAMFLLSVRAGLRAGEIATLRWGWVTDADSEVADEIEIPDDFAKKGGGRRIPMAEDLRGALVALNGARGDKARPQWPVIYSERGRGLSPNVVAQWFLDLYKRAGLTGCSSHSGRRTFLTRAARKISEAGGSLKDVQELAGHRSLASTQVYIEGSEDAKKRVVNLIRRAPAANGGR